MISIYGNENCLDSIQATSFLRTNGISFQYNPVGDAENRSLMESLDPNAESPIILVDGSYIGGYRELVEFVNNTMSTNPETNTKQTILNG